MNGVSEMTKTTMPAVCRNCGNTQITLCKKPKSNGGCHYYAVCLVCYENANDGGQWIARQWLIDQGFDLDAVPTLEELRAAMGHESVPLW